MFWSRQTNQKRCLKQTRKKGTRLLWMCTTGLSPILFTGLRMIWLSSPVQAMVIGATHYCIKILDCKTLTDAERNLQDSSRKTMRVIPASRHLWASTSPTAWQAATERVEASSRFIAHSCVEQVMTGSGESFVYTSAVMWCCVRENWSLRTKIQNATLFTQSPPSIYTQYPIMTAKYRIVEGFANEYKIEKKICGLGRRALVREVSKHSKITLAGLQWPCVEMG